MLAAYLFIFLDLLQGKIHIRFTGSKLYFILLLINFILRNNEILTAHLFNKNENSVKKDRKLPHIITKGWRF